MRVVVKIGSSSLTDESGRIDTDMIASVAAQVDQVLSAGNEVIVVTSGAVAAGVAGLSLDARPTDILTLQALSAVGQPLLMAAYHDHFARHGRRVAQVLLAPHDFADRQQYLHARETIERLMELGCVPIVNENDAVANDEIRYGDNDHLSALLSHLVSADHLVLLTDTDGLYTANPHTDADARIIEVVSADDPLLSVDTSGAGSARGSGGMSSKLAAARIASWSGVTAVIASARRPDAVVSAVANENVGTRFLPHDRHLSSRKLWIAFASEVEGFVTVDDGAKEAVMKRGTSLLPAGVVGVDGNFDTGAVVEVRDGHGRVLARGVAAMTSEQVVRTMGKRTDEFEQFGVTEVVHRDDMVVFSLL